MEGFGVLFALALIGVGIVLPIWVTAAVLNLRRQAESDRHENTRRWQDLIARLHVLESAVKDVKHEAVAPRVPAHETREPIAAAPVPVPAEPVPPPPSVVPPQVSIPAPALPAEPVPDVPRPEPPPKPAEVTPPAIPPSPAAPPLRPRRPSAPAPAYNRPAARPTPPRSGLDLEEMLGTNWLNKIGIGILVLRLAVFLAYQLQNLGPGGKVLLGLALSAGMIAVGVRYEANERYRILARASAAGGWALLYWLSFAVYNVPATPIIDSRELDFFLMIRVAAAIVWYS